MKILLFLQIVLAASALAAQEPHPHSMSGMPMPEPSVTAQTGSGTSWLPASTPEHMWMIEAAGWRLMLHGDLFVGYNQQGGPRGAGKLESQNWVMLMEERRRGRLRLQFRQMLSAEPLTAPRPGYPQLFQTGETYRGRALVDHQHPHDVFSEMAALLTMSITERANVFVYGGPAGEPALGPVAFVHRASAVENPAAPLAHHVQDSTHISFGVMTGGIVLGPVKAEASAFNGREPDERRYNFDLGPLDSWSVRFSAAPARNWTAQYGYGHLVHPEALEPGDITRQTASLAYNRPLARGNWASTLIWGRNFKESTASVQNSYLLESTLNFAVRNYAYTRLELVDKDELFPNQTASYRIGAFTFGGVRDLTHNDCGHLGLGADFTFYSKPAALDPIYGRDPVSFHVFLRFRPPTMKRSP